jgi:hypothetical protein
VTTSDKLPPQPDADQVAPGVDQLPEDRRRVQFRALSDALLFTFLIAGPASMWESLWRGRPMIDQPGSLWIAPTVIVIATFLVGGAIAGRLCPRPMGAVFHGLALAMPVAVVLILVDVARRLIIHDPLYVPVIDLWIDAVVAAIILAATGALIGRGIHRRRRRSASPTVESTLSRYARGRA